MFRLYWTSQLQEKVKSEVFTEIVNAANDYMDSYIDLYGIPI